jgi:hypothetical protein
VRIFATQEVFDAPDGALVAPGEGRAAIPPHPGLF